MRRDAYQLDTHVTNVVIMIINYQTKDKYTTTDVTLHLFFVLTSTSGLQSFI